MLTITRAAYQRAIEAGIKLAEQAHPLTTSEKRMLRRVGERAHQSAAGAYEQLDRDLGRCGCPIALAGLQHQCQNGGAENAFTAGFDHWILGRGLPGTGYFSLEHLSRTETWGLKVVG